MSERQADVSRDPPIVRSSFRRRPAAVSVICWILIISAVWTLLQLRTMGVALRYPPWVWLAPTAYAIAAIAMLRGRNWGRWALLSGYPVVTLLTVLSSGVKLWTPLLVDVGFYGTVLILLTRPDAGAYFSGPTTRVGKYTGPQTREAATRDLRGAFRRALAVCVLCVGALSLAAWLFMINNFASSGVFLLGSAILGTPMMVFMVLGLWTWGWARWIRTLGIVLTVSGAWVVIVSLLGLELSQARYLTSAAPTMDPGVVRNLLISGLVSGPLCLILGVILILATRIYQKSGALANHLTTG